MTYQKSIVVWSKQTCPYCQRVKKYLKEHHLNYSTVDVTDHDELRDVLETKYGIRHVPVTEIGIDRPHAYEAVISIEVDDLEKALKKNQYV